MSSILKALKKLENDAANQDVFIPWPQNTPTNRKGSVRAGRTGKTAKAICLIAILLIVVVSGAVWFGKRQKSVNGPHSGTLYSRVDKEIQKLAVPLKPPHRASPSALEKKPPPAIKQDTMLMEKPKPESLPVGPLRNQKGATPAEPSTGAPGNQKGVTPAKSPVGASRNQKGVTPETQPAIPYPEKKSRSLKKAQPAPIEKETKPSGPISKSDKERKIPAIPKKKSPPIELMDGTRLKLDAIAWSDDPEKRIAVINGRIVREGEPIEGFIIVRIDAEEVVVREGGKSWRVVFRIR